MLQQPEPDDYVSGHRRDRIRSANSSSLRLQRSAGTSIGRGHGVDEIGIDADTGKDLVRVDTRYFRPTEVDELLGDASKAAGRARLAPHDLLPRAGGRDGAVGFGGCLERGLAQGPRHY